MTELNASKIWQEALEVLERKIATVSYEIWIKNLRPFGISGGAIILVANLANNKRTVETTYKKEIKDALASVSEFITEFVVVLEEDLSSLDDFKLDSIEELQPLQEDILLFNKLYTFDNFVIGGSNQIAYHAAKSVAENPGGSFNNPLFVYGGVGLGKTHIIQAIGNNILSANPKTRILYINANRFVDDFMDSLRDDSRNKQGESNKKFRAKYRQNVDILMIDDIQFIENKGGSQDALFHTFNDLYQHGKQIIFTADRHPKELKDMNDRLLSRFQSGLTVDIAKPDLETRIAIIKKKAGKLKFKIADNITEFIAEKINTNIRELEGALQKVMFYCNLVGKPADDLDLVKEALRDYIDATAGELSMDSITDAVAGYFKVAKSELIGKKKSKVVAEPRQIAIYLIHEYLSPPLAAIGEFFGGRDHTTVMYARDKVSNLLETDRTFVRKIDDIKELIG